MGTPQGAERGTIEVMASETLHHQELVTIDEIRAAEKALAGVVRHTPMADSGPLTAKVGGPTFLKCENLQRAGSFKVRGAYVRIARLSEEERARGVVVASAGNHAQGVALAASLSGTKVTVFMPEHASLPKVTATRAYGATVRFSGESFDEALAAAQEFAAETDAVFIHPFDHRDIIAGQGTVALEIFEQCPDVKTILVPTGGGGLVAGVAAAAAALRPDVEVIAVEAAGAACFDDSLRVGHPVRRANVSTIADGIAVARPGELTFAHAQAQVKRIVTTSDESVSRALLFCLERAKLVVEPAGVVGVAALLNDPRAFKPPVVAILSGGNIDPLLLLRVIEHGLATAGRYLTITVRATDRPGSLASVLQVIAEEGGNVLDVWHRRQGAQLLLGDVDLSLAIETKGSEHSEHLVSTLRDHGYDVVLH